MSFVAGYSLPSVSARTGYGHVSVSTYTGHVVAVSGCTWIPGRVDVHSVNDRLVAADLRGGTQQDRSLSPATTPGFGARAWPTSRAMASAPCWEAVRRKVMTRP